VRTKELRRLNQEHAHQSNAASAKARKEREKFRAYPGSDEATLRAAVRKAGFKVLEYEYEVDNFFFDVAIDFGSVIGLVDMKFLNNKRNRVRDTMKEELCRRKGIPLLQLKRGMRLQEMYARVWAWGYRYATSAIPPRAESNMPTETSTP